MVQLKPHRQLPGRHGTEEVLYSRRFKHQAGATARAPHKRQTQMHKTRTWNTSTTQGEEMLFMRLKISRALQDI